MLSRLASDLAAEIYYHDWSDAPFRADRAGHRREHDSARSMQITPLDARATETLRTNVVWVAAQVLAHHDPNLDVYEFAEACGVNTSTSSGRPRSGHIVYGLRRNNLGQVDGPVLEHRCHVCSRAIDPDDRGEVRFEGITQTTAARPWVWGPVAVHEQCRLDLKTPFDDKVGDGFESTWSKLKVA